MIYKSINIIGGGLEGREVAFQLSQSGVKSNLFETQPHQNKIILIRQSF